MRKLNLKQEFKRVLGYVKQRIGEYSANENAGPGDPADDIVLITLGFSFEQAGWYALVFDTRPNATPDGDWQSYIDENWVEAPDWCLDDVDEISITHYDDNWKMSKGPLDDEFFAKLFGEMLTEVLKQARVKRLFSKLPVADDCCLYVEEHEGRYGWPAYNKRLKEGRIS